VWRCRRSIYGLQIKKTSGAHRGGSLCSAYGRFPSRRHLSARKALLGLALTYKGRPITLVNILWEPRNPDADPSSWHTGRELKAFADLVAGDKTCRFHYFSYPEHWRELESITDPPSGFLGTSNGFGNDTTWRYDL